MRPVGVVAALLLAAVPVAGRADEVFLVGGGRISGEVVERRADAIVVEVGPGRLTLPASRVARIDAGTSAVSVYRERASRLGPRDVAGWLALAAWARDNDLQTLANDAYERVLAVDPANEAAHRALGHVRVGREWMSEADSYRARGYVNFQGAWMTPDEAQIAAAQQAAEADARRAEREAVAREREAEARARAAEAEAARLAAEADAAAAAGGIPYGWVFAPGYPPYVTYGDHGRHGPWRRDRDAERGHRGDRGRHAERRGQDRREAVSPPARRQPERRRAPSGPTSGVSRENR